MEVLLKSGADVKDVDSLGHDAFHYARLSKNPELVNLVKGYLEKASKGGNRSDFLYVCSLWKQSISVQQDLE